jgi:hypothetical protein
MLRPGSVVQATNTPGSRRAVIAATAHRVSDSPSAWRVEAFRVLTPPPLKSGKSSCDQSAVKCAIIDAGNTMSTFKKKARGKMKKISSNDHFLDLHISILTMDCHEGNVRPGLNAVD